MAPRLIIRGLAGAGAAVLAALALTACGSDGSISAGGPRPDESTTTTEATETTVPDTTVAETLPPVEQVLPPDAGVTAALPCEQDALGNATAAKYGNAEGFLVTDCVGDWAAGSTRHEFDAPVEILFHAQDGAWTAIDRGFGMCDRQGVPNDVARQLGCSL
jgi:hypothetical protein